MSEWPENHAGLDLKWSGSKLLKIVLNLSLPILLLLGLGIAQATDLPMIVVTETADWLQSAAWFNDGAAGGFDAAGAAYVGW
jgi:hypothetical protein